MVAARGLSGVCGGVDWSFFDQFGRGKHTGTGTNHSLTQISRHSLRTHLIEETTALAYYSYIIFVQITMRNKSEPVRIVIEESLSFRAGDMVDLCAKVNAGKRTVDANISDMVAEGIITRVGRGLYVNSAFAEANPTNALSHVANTFQAGCSVSLYSSIADEYADKRNHEKNVYLIVSSGRCGILETDIGNIHFHQASSRLMKSLVQEFGVEAVTRNPEYSFANSNYRIKKHSPEMGMAMCAYLTACGERGRLDRDSAYRIAVDHTMVDWKMVELMAASARININYVNEIRDEVETFDLAPIITELAIPGADDTTHSM